jgi:2-haloacid dehalogenase
VGVTKPDKKIFEKLIEKSGVKASEIVFADDNKNSLQGAKEIGIQAFLYEDFSQFLRELEKLGVNL